MIYVPFDCKVVGEKALELVAQYESQANDPRHKVLVGFCLGDLCPSIYMRRSADNASKPDVSLKTHLLKIDWIKVDGVQVYKATAEDNDAEPLEEGAAANDNAVDGMLTPLMATPSYCVESNLKALLSG